MHSSVVNIRLCCAVSWGSSDKLPSVGAPVTANVEVVGVVVGGKVVEDEMHPTRISCSNMEAHGKLTRTIASRY